MIEDEKEVSVRKATLLEFDGVGIGDYAPKDVILCNIFHESFKLQVKDSRGEVRPVVGCLARPKIRSYLRPRRVSSHGDEEVWLSLALYDAHGIEVALLEFSRATTRVRTGKDDASTRHRRWPLCGGESTGHGSSTRFGTVVLQGCADVRG